MLSSAPRSLSLHPASRGGVGAGAGGGGRATVFLFNEPTDNGLWGALERHGTNCLVL